MKTPEKILDEVAAENMINIQQMVTTKQLVILAMKRYAKLYHESEIKKLNIPANIKVKLSTFDKDMFSKEDVKKILEECLKDIISNIDKKLNEYLNK
jgi:hypothetical protein